MKHTFFKYFIMMVAVSLITTSCTKHLERNPFYDVTSASVYQDFNNYKLILAKLYAGIAVSGQRGPDGRPA